MRQAKFFLLLAALTVSLTASAQKYHDAENDQLHGHVKSVTTTSGGQTQVMNYTRDGRIQADFVSNPSYNSSGYMTRCDYTMMGVTGHMTLLYNANNKVVKQTLNIQGGTITNEYTYNSDGTEKTEKTTMSADGMSQSMTVTFTYQAFDSLNNWTRRTGSVQGQSAQETRSITYWD